MLNKTVKMIPVVMAVGLIFALTMQNVTETVALSEGFRNWIIMVCERFDADTVKGWMDSTVAVRRLGHVIEYFVLGVAAAVSVRKKRYALLFCVCISLVDQIIKIYVPGRHFDWVDILFDAVGYLSGSAVVFALRMIFSRGMGIGPHE